MGTSSIDTKFTDVIATLTEELTKAAEEIKEQSVQLQTKKILDANELPMPPDLAKATGHDWKVGDIVHWQAVDDDIDYKIVKITPTKIYIEWPGMLSKEISYKIEDFNKNFVLIENKIAEISEEEEDMAPTAEAVQATDGTITLIDTTLPGDVQLSTDVNEAFDKIKEANKEAAEMQENPVKQEVLSQGIMFSAGKSQIGEEPFYIEVHLDGQDTYKVSAGKNGVLTRNDIKALRKALKSVMNKEKQTYNLETEKPNQIAPMGGVDVYTPPTFDPPTEEEMDFDDYEGDADF